MRSPLGLDFRRPLFDRHHELSLPICLTRSLPDFMAPRRPICNGCPMDIGAPSARRGTKHEVPTLNQMGFDAAWGSLMRTVLQDYKPTLLVGVRTGGLIVAEAMALSF